MVDIDRTIAHTPINFSRDSKVLEFSFYPDMVKMINSLIKDENSFLVFCSVRPLKTYYDTNRWLRKVGFNIKWDQLIFTRSPMQKYKILKFFHDKNINVKIIDDLTYDHKNCGSFKYYTEVIKKLKESRIDHLTFKEIQKYQVMIKKI
tara:strand:- start:375 stop:818 length:444 start_codon:yes stop_codon:yes gene_type:complete